MPGNQTPASLLLRLFAFVRGLEQVEGTDLQGVSNPTDVDQGRVAFPALNTADIGAVQPGPGGQLLLGDAEPVTQRADAVAKGDAQVFGHPSMVFIGQTPRDRL